jgi:hypothetical protein
LRLLSFLASKLNPFPQNQAVPPMQIFVKQILNSDAAIFHDEGLRVFESFGDCLQSGRKTVLSFKDITTCSTQFLNACVGKAYMSFPFEKVKDLLLIEDYKQMPLFGEKVSAVIDNALNYKEYEPFINSALA